ncbi:hypothetical protein [Streptomyces sp. NBC_00829]|uniref:hypothetical protein n=1 Tax=Streptomyces sp. NBC_00829 TaxID=2903679 RepID=UPI003866CCBE|nr:hypothetical protein OG293_04030 [Streptomyces sp. NBC_00829]
MAQVGFERADVGYEPADGLVERRFDETGLLVCGLRIARVGVAEQLWSTGPQEGEGVGEFGLAVGLPKAPGVFGLQQGCHVPYE